MEVNNPYLDEIRQIYLQKEQDRDVQKLNELTELSRKWSQEKLEELSSGIPIVDEKIVEIQDKDQYPSLTKQYKQACQIYQEIWKQVEEIREIKKNLREEIKAKKHGGKAQ